MNNADWVQKFDQIRPDSAKLPSEGTLIVKSFVHIPERSLLIFYAKSYLKT